MHSINVRRRCFPSAVFTGRDIDMGETEPQEMRNTLYKDGGAKSLNLLLHHIVL